MTHRSDTTALPVLPVPAALPGEQPEVRARLRQVPGLGLGGRDQDEAEVPEEQPVAARWAHSGERRALAKYARLDRRIHAEDSVRVSSQKDPCKIRTYVLLQEDPCSALEVDLSALTLQ